MRLTFEDVSYSYEGGEAKKKRRRKKDAARQADWGNAPGAMWALRDVSFAVEPGEFFGIAGHTGSGKSTLIQHMNGLVHPTCGRVLADGRDLAEKGVAAEVRRQVGLVFQYPENQLFANTVYDDVAFGPRNMGLGAEEVDRRVREGLALVGLSFGELSERSPFDLSGGQQRRVAFAGVLAMEPEVLVLDEPVAGLDPLSREEFLGLIRELHAGGRTIVMVSHSMEDLAALCDRILVLSEGRAFRLGAPAEVFADASALKAVGLGAPAPEAFASSLREAGFALGRDLYDERTLAVDIAVQLAAVSAPAGPDAMGGFAAWQTAAETLSEPSCTAAAGAAPSVVLIAGKDANPEVAEGGGGDA